MIDREPTESHQKELPTHLYELPKTDGDWEGIDLDDEMTASMHDEDIVGTSREDYLGLLRSYGEAGRNSLRFWNMLVKFVPRSGFRLPQDRPTSILDLACGKCEEGIQLAKFFGGKSKLEEGEIGDEDIGLYGIDSDSELIKSAIYNNGKIVITGHSFNRELPPNYHFEVGDATKLDEYPSFPSQTDIIMIKHQQMVGGPDYDYSSTKAVEVWEKIIGQAFERLSAGGIIIITSYYDFENQDLIRLLENFDCEILVNETNPYSRSLIDERDDSLKDGNKDYKILIVKKK